MNSRPSQKNGMLHILFIASEAEPLVKVGGLGDVAGSLPHALRRIDPETTGGYYLDVRLVLPHHAAIRKQVQKPRPLIYYSIPYKNEMIEALVSVTNINGLPVYLISGEPIPYRAPVYSSDSRQDAEKYVFFSLAALEMTRQIDWQPDIIQANDWHTATAVYSLSSIRESDPFFSKTRSTLIIHNLPYMGASIEEVMTDFNLPSCTDSDLPEWAKCLPLPLGIQTSDLIVTVSPSYAKEILSPEFGNGLDGFLNTRADSIIGILNGLDIEEWNPATDEALPASFSLDDLTPRINNTQALRKDFSLEQDPDIPLIIMITRMDYQKGIDLAIDALLSLSDRRWQLIILGTGDPQLENACQKLEEEMPDRIRAAIRFDSRLARQLYGGGDMILIPSRYEPCGLAQMIAMRYGCVPVARATGGLSDSIIDAPNYKDSTGFLFNEISSKDLIKTLNRALTIYEQPEIWRAIQINGLKQDFSWQKSAQRYSQAYLELQGVS